MKMTTSRRINHNYGWGGASLVAQWLQLHLSKQESQETRVRSLGWEDPLEKEMVTHSSIPVEEVPWTEEPGGLQSTTVQESDMTE